MELNKRKQAQRFLFSNVGAKESDREKSRDTERHVQKLNERNAYSQIGTRLKTGTQKSYNWPGRVRVNRKTKIKSVSCYQLSVNCDSNY